MNAFGYAVMYAWIPIVIGLFAVLRPRRAVIVAFLGGYLFLPLAAIPISGLPDYTKVSATNAGLLLGVALFDMGRLLSFRPRLIDLPMLCWCLWPFVSGMANGLEAYHSFSAAFVHGVTWGIPYFIGRLYFGEPGAARQWALAFFIAGLVYVPLCVFEARMSPLLHPWVYGFAAGPTKVRNPGLFGPLASTPAGFVGNYLRLTLLMGSAAIVGTWLWATGALKRLFGLPMIWLVAAVWAATFLCKALGANALCMAGMLALVLARGLRTSLPLVCLAIAPPLYMVARATGSFSGDSTVQLIREEVSADRAESLEGRLVNEAMLVEKAMAKPFFGWGPWGEYRVLNEQGEDISVTDGLWIITFGKYGLPGVFLLTSVFLLPVAALLRGVPGRSWGLPAYAHMAALSVVVVLYMADSLFNAFLNPVFTLTAGALSGLAGAVRSESDCVTYAGPVAAGRAGQPHLPYEA